MASHRRRVPLTKRELTRKVQRNARVQHPMADTAIPDNNSPYICIFVQIPLGNACQDRCMVSISSNACTPRNQCRSHCEKSNAPGDTNQHVDMVSRHPSMGNNVKH